MLGLSQSVGYAVRALICLEDGNCNTRFVQDIATCSGVPPAYLAKIFKRLVDSRVLEAKRGPAGGTRLARPKTDISLLQIVEAVDGPGWIGNCLLGPEACRDSCTCPTHEFWTVERRRIEDYLRRTTLDEVTSRSKMTAASHPSSNEAEIK